MKHLRALNKYFWKYRVRFGIGILFIIISNYFGVLSPQVTGFVIEFVQQQLQGLPQKSTSHNYDVLVEKSVSQRSDPVYSTPFSRTFYNPYRRRFINVYYPSQFMGYDNYDVPSREGTVTISMIDAQTDKTVWQGWSTDEVNSRNMSSKEIQSSVKVIFRKFDVAKN